MSDTKTIIIGGGQAGLALSYCLTQRSIEHVILERRRVAERWHAERWDSLAFQFPNWALELPGHHYQGNDPDGFCGKSEVTRFIEDYASKIKAPVMCGVDVVSVEWKAARKFEVRTDNAAFESSNVVVATGPFQQPVIPAFSASLPSNVIQLSANQYLNPGQLPDGNVLVVGSGSSGTQITEELFQSGRKVYLSVSPHQRAPRRYRGQDLCRWLFETGRFDRMVDDLPGRKPPPPLVLTGFGGGHDIDFRQFALDGVTLLGRLQGAEDGVLALADDLEKNLAAGDQSIADFKHSVDDCVTAKGIDAEPANEDEPRSNPRLEPIDSLDIAKAGITSVIWCTGYKPAFDWVKLPIFDERGSPKQRRGVTEYAGLYFLGLYWMHKFKSSALFGVGEDAAFLADAIANRHALA